MESKRFNEMKRCHDISPRILSKELKELEMYGIISRTEVNDSLKTVNYALTDIGTELIPIIVQFQKWGSDYRQKFLLQMK
jgi:DNA-binding HxlR family transcriptional regulator